MANSAEFEGLSVVPIYKAGYHIGHDSKMLPIFVSIT